MKYFAATILCSFAFANSHPAIGQEEASKALHDSTGHHDSAGHHDKFKSPGLDVGQTAQRFGVESRDIQTDSCEKKHLLCKKPNGTDKAVADNTDAPAPDADYPPGELGKIIRLGETLVNETSSHPLTAPLVGNRLNCTSCHLDAGRHPKAASFIGVAAAYPAYSPRESAVITLEDRIAICFQRSQNGTRPVHGKVTIAIAAYITWLSQQTPIEMNPYAPLGKNHLVMLDGDTIQPVISRGETLYANRCADCHLDNGSGSEDGPPLWGDESFNDGAGLSKLAKLASWLKVAMPPDEADLTDQEAFDLAAYVNSHSRPKFRPENESELTTSGTSGH